MERAVRAASVGSLSHGMRGSAEIGKIAATEAMAAAKELGAALERTE